MSQMGRQAWLETKSITGETPRIQQSQLEVGSNRSSYKGLNSWRTQVLLERDRRTLVRSP
jgi:hypothetical protein